MPPKKTYGKKTDMKNKFHGATLLKKSAIIILLIYIFSYYTISRISSYCFYPESAKGESFVYYWGDLDGFINNLNGMKRHERLIIFYYPVWLVDHAITGMKYSTVEENSPEWTEIPRRKIPRRGQE